MPLLNKTGEALPLLHVSPKEKKKLDFLTGLKYPENEAVIFHLHPEDFKVWLHGLNPREALLLTSSERLSAKIRKQASFDRWSVVTDWLWRLFH